MTDESWHAVRNITGVTGFVGPGSRPTPLTEAEVAALNFEEEVRVTLSYKEGDMVEIIEGLEAGEEVATTSFTRLMSGKAVTVNNESAVENIVVEE
jgi:transcriptional antiterminator NusG